MAVGQTHCCLIVVLAAVLAGSSWAEEDFQQWSVQTHMDEEYTFTCNDSVYPIFVNDDDKLTWRRHGHEMNIENNAHFELSPVGGLANMELTVKKVTDEMTGIYFCEIRSASDVHVGRIVKALNIGGHKYDDAMDKYRSHIITGVIAGASVFFFIASICAIDQFRYQSEEERQEKRDAKEKRLRRKSEVHDEAHENLGFETTAGNGGADKNGLGEAGYDNIAMVNTHL